MSWDTEEKNLLEVKINKMEKRQVENSLSVNVSTQMGFISLYLISVFNL